MEKNVKEIWKDVKGYEGLYQVSNLGRVKRLAHYRSHFKGGKSFFLDKILKNSINNEGYVNYKLYNKGLKKTIKGHRLVATHFIENNLKLKEVNHIDGFKSNNCVSNLEWVSIRGNQSHRYKKQKTSSKYAGVSYRSDLKNQWVSQYRLNYKTIHIGCFETEKQAAIAYESEMKRLGFINKYSGINS